MKIHREKVNEGRKEQQTNNNIQEEKAQKTHKPITQKPPFRSLYNDGKYAMY